MRMRPWQDGHSKADARGDLGRGRNEPKRQDSRYRSWAELLGTLGTLGIEVRDDAPAQLARACEDARAGGART